MTEEANDLLDQLRELAESKTIEELIAECAHDYEVTRQEVGRFDLERVWRNDDGTIRERGGVGRAYMCSNSGELVITAAGQNATRVCTRHVTVAATCEFVVRHTGSSYLDEKLKSAKGGLSTFLPAQAAAEILEWEKDLDEDCPTWVSRDVVSALMCEEVDEEDVYRALSEVDSDWYDGAYDFGMRPTQQYVDACLIARAIVRHTVREVE